ncbi:hypothetical protein FEM03_14865 [Phragmitibacter flavus]|uniref:DUF4032 domain-containing protein n=1 Tax=Phragmitibacter flavus TaxID=2576071 RepID=A0A5R8KCH8_9BACT|nr:hypothetical protein [Phragmitibacter flavus]TLD70010.1 hypothetical protein FEM03_14865 [Phragmitibacter flavus]
MASPAQSRTAISYYEEYLAELDEIRRYKWIESQKAKEDIGFERALVEWVTEHRDAWRIERSEAAE